ncbi:putative lipoprotein/autotransporter domain-containing protein [Limihaloglobus sulfuriphilus]|uniref:Putative lipoprotein/autotransporter domain-containing protein n=1 Tax=Limihaloglobus sulfuriphilus TaxID=1851148 RepID=A0A1Q2MI29_9BACT|nr:PEP-CTERM sorting domain-containing protein [Limihaloglobus sulfuriphilus]AQQ72314.1 putative lipoprotein/autotransporter domain-containing protein [Limihaloglobus sulfuriphilus]
MRSIRHFVFTSVLICVIGTGFGAITATGDVSPANPAGWTASTSPVVGGTADGSLSITSGSSVTNGTCLIANSAGVTGSVTVNAGSWNTGLTSVGQKGSGSMTVSGGGSVYSTSSLIVSNAATASGSVSVSGINSSISYTSITVSQAGTGSLDISNGGSVTARTNLMRAGNDNASGVTYVNVDGPLSRLNVNNNYLYAGWGSNAIFNVTNSGMIISKDAVIGRTSDSTVSLSGSGSGWVNTYSIYVGYSGDNSKGTLNVSGGGFVDTQGIVIGDDQYSSISQNVTGNVSVEGEGSYIAAELTRLGYSQDQQNVGSLAISQGGLVITDYLYLYNDSSINLSSGGMLALAGEGDASVEAFLGLLDSYDASYTPLDYSDSASGSINIWDESEELWVDLTDAVRNFDYNITYHSAGDFAGYTVLTADAVPEPATALLMGFGALAAAAFKKRKQ